MDGVKSAMEMHVVHYKTQRTAAQEVAAAAGLGYSASVLGATATPVDPAGVAVISYLIDVGFFISLFS